MTPNPSPRFSCLPCIVCGRKLENVFEDSENQASDGLAFRSYGQYGSTVFDPMDGQFLEINVCDTCLEDGRKEKVLLGRGSTRKLKPWRLRGSQR